MPKLSTRLLQLMAAIAVTAIPMQSRAEMIDDCGGRPAPQYC